MLRDRNWLNRVRYLPCVTCNATEKSDPSHIRKSTDGGTGLKPSDDKVLPQCRKCHMENHRIGELSFWYPFGGYELAAARAKELYETYTRNGDILEKAICIRSEFQNRKSQREE